MDRALFNQQIEHAAVTVPGSTLDVPGSVLQVIRVRMQDTQYAIELKYVECVLPLMELQPVPGGAYYLAGLMDYHGKSVAVVDLGMWLGLNYNEAYHLDTPVIVCGGGGAQLALIVSEVLLVEMTQPSAIHLQALFNEGSTPFKASLKLSSGIVLLLDMPRILNINFTTADSLSSLVPCSFER